LGKNTLNLSGRGQSKFYSIATDRASPSTGDISDIDRTSSDERGTSDNSRFRAEHQQTDVDSCGLQEGRSSQVQSELSVRIGVDQHQAILQ
jgi:hypothetical protein